MGILSGFKTKKVDPPALKEEEPIIDDDDEWVIVTEKSYQGRWGYALRRNGTRIVSMPEDWRKPYGNEATAIAEAKKDIAQRRYANNKVRKTYKLTEV